MFRRVLLVGLIFSTLVFAGCFSNKKVNNPIADINSKQPDKVLYDRAMDAMKHNKFDVARLSLQTLINTYPDSEYVAAPSWRSAIPGMTKAAPLLTPRLKANTRTSSPSSPT